MIHQVVPALVNEMNRFLQSKHDILEEKVLLSNLVNADGSIAIQETDKIIATLTNIELERNKSNPGAYKQTAGGGYSKLAPPVEVNVYLLFSAYFTNENYLEGLKFISSVIAFFQSRQGVFTAQNTASLTGIVEKLSVEMVSPDFRDLSNVWGGLGAKYMPSVLYRIKTLSIEHSLPAPEIPSIRAV